MSLKLFSFVNYKIAENLFNILNFFNRIKNISYKNLFCKSTKNKVKKKTELFPLS